MIRRLAWWLVPVALLAGACVGGDGDSGGDGKAEPTQAPEPTATETVGDTDGTGAADAVTNPFAGAPGLFQTFGNAQGQVTLEDVDPALKAVLLEAGDLPAGFLAFGEYGFSTPTEFGPVDAAMNMFLSPGESTTAFGAMVMSMAMVMPPEALEEAGALDWTEGLSQEELDEIAAAGDLYGIGFSNLRALDAAGLGDGGAGMHMEMDLSGLAGGLGGAQDELGGVERVAFDMYAFVQDDLMLMVMVIWPGEDAPGVDARALADAMDARAAAR